MVELFPLLHPLHAIASVDIRLDALLRVGPVSTCSADAMIGADVLSVASRRRRCRRARRVNLRGPNSCQPTYSDWVASVVRVLIVGPSLMTNQRTAMLAGRTTGRCMLPTADMLLLAFGQSILLIRMHCLAQWITCGFLSLIL